MFDHMRLQVSSAHLRFQMLAPILTTSAFFTVHFFSLQLFLDSSYIRTCITTILNTIQNITLSILSYR